MLFAMTKTLLALLVSLSAAGLRAEVPTEPEARGSTDLPSGTAAVGEPLEFTRNERLLMERIEQLEKRLAEIEAGGAKPAAGVIAGAAAESVVNWEAPEPGTKEPFAFADWSWLTGNARYKDVLLASKVFTGIVRADVGYTYSLNHPSDDTLSGSTEVFRHNEVALTDFGIGGEFNYANFRAKLLTQFGMYSQTQPRNDPSPGRGQYDLSNAMRYIGEAYGGYHINALHGINVDAGLFLSYIGLFSFYQYENWAYQPSYVSSNTPWYFMGVRAQIFTSEKLKIEPWIINGWQSYGKFNKAPGVGGQILWRPNGSLSVVSNNYWGTDTLGNPDRKRVHSDNSIQVKYFENAYTFLNMAAFSITLDAGCEYGGGVSCTGGEGRDPAQYFLGYMAYNRFWFANSLFGLTLGGGQILNPGRYLVILPPINGANAFSGTPYFTAAPGDSFKAWDASITLDYMPTQWTTFRLEYNHRHSAVPYFAGPGGITPPGGNQGPPGSFVPGFTPDLVKNESRFTLGLLIGI